MPYVIDDIAVVASAESVTTTEAVSSVEAVADTTPSVEASKWVPDCVSDSQLSDLKDTKGDFYYDEYPTSELQEVTTTNESLGEEVHYDSYPVDSTTESLSENTSVSEAPQELSTPTTYEELCETRASGGSYGEIRSNGWGWNDNPPREVHHMPADSVSHLERSEGPAIAMDYKDHQQTASCGSSREAKEYRSNQKELIDNGDFRGALQMDIDDLHDKFGDKYDNAISQMSDYVDKLESQGKFKTK